MGAAAAHPLPNPAADGEGMPPAPWFGVAAASQGDEVRECERERAHEEKDGSVDMLGPLGHRMANRTPLAIGGPIPLLAG